MFFAATVELPHFWCLVCILLSLQEHAYLDPRSWFVIAHLCSLDADVRWTGALVPFVRSQMIQNASVQLHDLQNARVPASLGSVRMVVHVLYCKDSPTAGALIWSIPKLSWLHSTVNPHKISPHRKLLRWRSQNNLVPKLSHTINMFFVLLIHLPHKRIFPLEQYENFMAQWIFTQLICFQTQILVSFH